MDSNALKETKDIIDKKVANKEQIVVPLQYIYWSDGKSEKIPAPITGLEKQDPGHYLKMLSETYSKMYDVNLVFTSLPPNYTVWKSTAKRGDVFLYGHARGRYPSVTQFCPHLWSLLNNNVAQCKCNPCQGTVRGIKK
ncbi:hypothetical protein D6C99_00821 [Aureobasidium pullulans]|nr:hypothetical protein D6D27_07572 [Aureobasidium pullulans]THV88222.1 hypothetical protein D6D29_00086 [Aureobasidium pullulans]THY62703.1 hypothetical protein D6C99_00821 [Aureobasidium pullulans]